MAKNNYSGPERRKHYRTDANFVVSYRLVQQPDNYDLSRSKNVSQGGMLITTNRKFDKGTLLALTIRFPFVNAKIEIVGEVVDSRMIVTNLIYETRLRFLNLSEDIFSEIGKFVDERLGK